MYLARVGAIGHERPVVVDSNQTFDLTPLTGDIDGTFLAAAGISRIRAALDAGELPAVDITGERLGSPVAKPGAVVCIGMNYAAHAAESGSAPPERPIIFLKHPNTIVGPNDDVPIPTRSTKTDWEVELAVVIGRPVYELTSDAEALDSVAGYTIADDLSERTWQLEESGGQWSKGKCAPFSTPLGPYLVPAAEVDSSALNLTSSIDGQPRQDSSTADLIFSVARILRDLSGYMQLDPGDVVLTGTPEGVALSGRFPYLRPGNVAEIAVTGLGRQRHTFVDGSNWRPS